MTNIFQDAISCRRSYKCPGRVRFLFHISHAPRLLDCDFLHSLSTVLVNRLVLNLRKVGNPHISNITTIPQPRFTMNGFLDNIGASLRDGSEDIYIGEDSETYELEGYAH